jgi:hypothetical protein
MSSQTLLSTGDKWFSYSGEMQGDSGAPASISMVLIPNTGLRDSYVEILPFFGQEVSSGVDEALGIQILIDSVSMFTSQSRQQQQERETIANVVKIFVPRQSKLEILSINTNNNNSQIRGVSVIGYYL